MKITYALEDRLDTSFYPGLYGEVLTIFKKYNSLEFKNYKKEIIDPIEQLVKDKTGLNIEFVIHTKKDAFYNNAYAQYDRINNKEAFKKAQPEEIFEVEFNPSTGKFKGKIVDLTRPKLLIGQGIFNNDPDCEDAVDTFLHELGHHHWYFRHMCAKLTRSIYVSSLLNNIANAEGRTKEDVKKKRAVVIKEFEKKTNVRLNYNQDALLSDDPNELISSMEFPGYFTKESIHASNAILVEAECEEYADTFMVKNGGGRGMTKNDGKGLGLDFYREMGQTMTGHFIGSALFFSVSALTIAVGAVGIGLIAGVIGFLISGSIFGGGHDFGTYAEIKERFDNIRRMVINKARTTGMITESQLLIIDDISKMLENVDSSRDRVNKYFVTFSRDGKALIQELNLRDIGSNRLFAEALRTKAVIG